jgi:hypothetical protein
MAADTLDLAPIQAALRSGDKALARRLLAPHLKGDAVPADLWYLASLATERTEQEVGCLRRALRDDPYHSLARKRYQELRAESDLPPLEALVNGVHASLGEEKFDTFGHKQQQKTQRRRLWTRLGCAGSIIMSLSSSYLVLSLLGSPIPSQIRQVFTGERPMPLTGSRPLFGLPTAPALPTIPPINTPVPSGNGSPATLESYEAEATAAGFVVRPTKTEVLAPNAPISDILDPGYAHEYLLQVESGQEVFIGVQFFSPTAKNVGPNVGILGPSGYSAEASCERGVILVDGSSLTYICRINTSGEWKLQLFGQPGASTGVYVVTYQVESQ